MHTGTLFLRRISWSTVSEGFRRSITIKIVTIPVPKSLRIWPFKKDRRSHWSSFCENQIDNYMIILRAQKGTSFILNNFLICFDISGKLILACSLERIMKFKFRDGRTNDTLRKNEKYYVSFTIISTYLIYKYN